ncbi:MULTISPECIES: KH domain-containing protein [Leptotrichia]|uniref:KH domain-containing protein n=1 Tax=Leptotrichia TaxID=32067 RepID=UPI00041D9B99|nr:MULTISPECIES: KH domain-containing protein [Leptotrichia]WLD73491.1 KH domain-containing protein [Leptotrichia sp. HMT-225]
MSKYFETVDFWVENLLDSTESYTIESNEKGKFVDITINVIKDDMGKVIGKNGRIITALRVLMSSLAKKDRKSVKIEVKEM